MGSGFIEPAGRTSSRRAAAVVQTRASLSQASLAAAAASARALAGLQKPEGYWCGDLLADTTLESDYVLLQLWLYPPAGGAWNPPTAERIRKARAAILARQQAGGGFDIYPGGPADVSASA
jgi:squalene-hopene/tetraprenyl-beta-curcumene cyclase